MASVKQMQGVSAYLEPLRSDGIRRNISWCKYSRHMGKHVYMCGCEASPYYGKECHSAKQCDFYLKNK